MSTTEVIIIGAGPAGLAAAGALGRGRRSVLVIGGAEHRNRGSHAMHGVLGNEGTDPAEFLALSRQQILSRYPTVRMSSDTVLRAAAVGTSESPAFEVETASGAVYHGRRLILASGAVDELPDIPGFADCWPQHIYQCLICDGLERADGPLGVGVLARPFSQHHIHLALRARCFNSRVIVYTDGHDIDQAEEAFAPLLAQEPGITLQHAPIARLESQQSDVHVHLQSGATERVDFLIYKTLTHPASADLVAQLRLARTDIPGHGSFIEREEPTGATSVPGVYVCGDAGTPVKGVAPAMAQGVCAADVIWGSLVEEDKYKEK